MTHDMPSFPGVQSDNDKPLPSIHEKRDADKRWDSIHRRYRFLTAVCMLLAALIGGVVWYEYPLLAAHKADLIKLPELAQSVDTMASHLRQTDTTIADWSRQQNIDRQGLQTQITKLTRDVRTGAAAARKDASDAANAAYRRIETRVEEQIDGVQTRLASLETMRDADQKQIAALHDELAQVRRDVSQQSDKIAAVEWQIKQNSTSARSEIAGIQQEQGREQHDVNAIASELAVDKIPFEAEKGQDRKLADGISLHISGTDTSRGQFNGWMALTPGQASIRFRRQSVQEPLTFYGPQDGRKRELVITGVARHSVTGYLLVPRGSRPAGAAGDSGA